ncbi:MAG: DJ-1/PfpI family protein [Deltaproteobacteria bacterium]|nr:DJ-1/PfpI family protein [Deltaproteobacteria bacterium]
MKNALVILAPGFEEIEATTPVDLLRRAGARVILAGTIKGPIEGKNHVSIATDATIDNVLDEDFDLIILPGGAVGTENLNNDTRVKEIVLCHYDNNRLVAAICAAPMVLSSLEITKGKRITAHPSVHSALKNENLIDERVVEDGNIITSQGPGTAIEFSLKLVELLFGKEKAKEIARAIIFNP